MKTATGLEAVLYSTEGFGKFPNQGCFIKNGVKYSESWSDIGEAMMSLHNLVGFKIDRTSKKDREKTWD